ncbi:MAG: DUF6803 family protein [Chitinophagales bacterium]
METMTHYMQLLTENQPWNLIIFMVIPVVAAETIAITELFILFSRELHGSLRKINRVTGIIGGIYFLGIFIYLLVNAVIPLTVSGEWRGPADIIAVGSYLSGVIPLLGMTLLETGFIGRNRTDEEKLKLHATFVAVFLVVAHVAMIFGMLNPSVLGYGAVQMPPMNM